MGFFFFYLLLCMPRSYSHHPIVVAHKFEEKKRREKRLPLSRTTKRPFEYVHYKVIGLITISSLLVI